MANLQNWWILAVLCTFLIADVIGAPHHEKTEHRDHDHDEHDHHDHDHDHDHDHHKRSTPEDMLTKTSVDDPQVKKYAEKGIEKLAETSTGPTDPVLEKILEATFFPPAGKLLYEIKMKVASKKTKDASQECKVNVWRESDGEPSVTVECTQARRRRADDIYAQIADFPTKLSIDDPNVKKYAQVAVDKMGGPSSEMKGILKEIVDATSYPPSGKLLYTVKLKIGSTKCPKESNEQNCEYDPEAGYNNCSISVFKETNEEDSTSIECWKPLENAGNHLYEIKMKTKDVSQVCKMILWRESYAEPSVSLECDLERRKRADADGGEGSFVPLILDQPLQVSSAEPNESILEKIEKAVIAIGENKSCKVRLFNESEKPRVKVDCD